MKKHITLFMFIISVSLAAQGQTASNMVVEMIKFSAKELQENQPEDQKEQIIENATPFIPTEGDVSAEMIEKYTSSLADSLKLKLISNGYALIDDKEYPEIKIQLSANYESYPDYRSANGWIDVVSVKDSKGKALLIDDATYEQYVELGVIDQGFNYPIPGIIENDLYLKEEPDWSAPLQVEGTLNLSCPTAYQAVSFSKADAGITKEIAGHKITLLSMEKDQVVFRVDGVKQFSNISQLYLNESKKPFQGNSHLGVPGVIYDAVQENGGSLSDEKINEIAAAYDPHNISSKVYVADVTGACNYVVFYKVTSTTEQTIPFNLKLVANLNW